jgi:hypothetical protein
MKEKIVSLILVCTILVLDVGFTLAQHPNDPGYPDTAWIERINMNQVIAVGGFGRDFAIKCSVYTDQGLAGFTIPLTFYHARNTDIFADSVKYESWVPTPDISSFNKHNSTSGDTAKTLLFGTVWFTDSLPPNRAVLCKIWFHTGKPYYAFDTTKSIVLDTCTYYPPETGTQLEFVTTLPRPAYKPVFVPGAIGYPRTISGKVSGTSLPALVTVSGDRKKKDLTDNSGNYSFLVGKGGRWIVFRDSVTARYTIDPCSVNVSGLNFVGTSDVREVVSEEKVLPEAFSLNQNYPNPFNPNTMIRFSLPQDCWVKLEVYNLLGQKVKTLVDQMLKAGTKEAVWDGKNQAGVEVSSGIYFYKIQTKDLTDIKKMVLVK